MSTSQVPKTHRALVLTSRDKPPKVEVVPTPEVTPGSAIVKILAANVIPYQREIYNGTRPYPYPTPLVIGSSAIGRIAAVGADATLFKPGQLVMVDIVVRGRDDPSAAMLLGVMDGYSPGSKKLMEGEWRNATYAQYAKLPLENCFAFDEKRLLGAPGDGGLGYGVEDLAFLPRLLVPYGGLRDIGLKPAETVIVAPATASFGGAAVLVALAMGAKVIAMGRNQEVLKKIGAWHENVETVPITGDVEAEVKALQQHGQIDAFFDISPPEAVKSTHFKSCILALKHSGRVSLMGGMRDDVPLPHSKIMRWNLQLKGKWMYEREDVYSLMKLVEFGALKLGEKGGLKTVGKFGLEDWDKAFTAAAENATMDKQALIVP